MAETPRSEARRLMLEKIETSGLTANDAKLLRFNGLTAKQTTALDPSFKALPSLYIPYFGIDGQPLQSFSSSSPEDSFFRLRYLEAPKGFEALTGKQPRYVQKPGSGVTAYFPSNITNWQEISLNSRVGVLITEGELKAAKAAKEGYPTIGLGGVYNFRSAKDGISFLPELEQINWANREVFMIYDSDYRTNPQICAALRELATVLADRGARPRLVSLPDLSDDPEEKTGLDDFLLKTAPEDLASLLLVAKPLTLSEALWRMNEKVVFVRDPGLIVERSGGQKLSIRLFKDGVYATENQADWVLRNDGEVTLKTVSAASAWIKWPLREEASRITYVPGAERFITEGNRRYYNAWPGWGCVPSKTGTVRPFLELIDHLFKEAPQNQKDWFLDWCAYPLQNPGTKLFTSAVIFGTKNGTGKSLVGYTLGKIYGKNFTEISQADLHSSFNEWAECKQLVLADDVLGSDRRREADHLKKLITQKEMRVNAKFIPTYVVPDCLNYFFTSNHPDAFFLADDDRRFFVHEVVVDPLPERFYLGYDLWKDGNGPEALFQWFLDRDISGFNPTARAMQTDAKNRMISDGRSDLGSWIEKLRTAPDSVLTVGDVALTGDLFSSNELLALYDPAGSTRTTAGGVGRELKRQGVRQVLGGRTVRSRSGVDRYYAIRNVRRWLDPSTLPGEVSTHLNENRAGTGPKKY